MKRLLGILHIQGLRVPSLLNVFNWKKRKQKIVWMETKHHPLPSNTMSVSISIHVTIIQNLNSAGKEHIFINTCNFVCEALRVCNNKNKNHTHTTTTTTATTKQRAYTAATKVIRLQSNFRPTYRRDQKMHQWRFACNCFPLCSLHAYEAITNDS